MKVTMYKQIGAASMLGFAVLASGCGGGAQSSLPTAAKVSGTTAGSAKATLTIKIPVRNASAASRKRLPKYVSAYTTELAIRAGVSASIDTAAWQIFNVGPSAPVSPNISCSTAGGVRTCVATVTAPAVQGTVDEFQIAATDSPTVATDTAPTGNYLSEGDTTQTVTVGAANAVNVALSPNIGVLTASPTAYSVWAAPGTSANVVASITAEDIDTGIIFGQPSAFANPLTFADGLPASPFTYPSANLAATPPNYGVPPPETAGPVQATIVYTAPATVSVPAATVTVTTIIPDYLPTPAVTPSAAFTLHPMVVSQSDIATPGSGTATGTLSIATGRLKFVTVNELGTTGFTVTTSDPTQAPLENAGGGALVNPLVPDANGNVVFLVVAGAPTAPATAPTITVTDATGTVAALPVTITATAAPASSARR